MDDAVRLTTCFPFLSADSVAAREAPRTREGAVPDDDRIRTARPGTRPQRRGRHRSRGGHADLWRGRGGGPRPAGRVAGDRAPPADRRDGAVRLRQVDADAHPRRPRPARQRHRDDRRDRHHGARRRRADQAAPQPHRVHLPVLQPAPDAHRGGEHPPPARDRQGASRCRLARGGHAQGRAHGPAHAPSGRALGRPAAARGGRARRRGQARRDVRRRADRQPGLAHGRGDPRTAARHGRLAGADDGDGDPRPAGRGDRRSRALPRRRPHRARPEGLHGARDPGDDGGAGGVRRVTLKGLAFRKVRALLTALAVVLGVAMVSGTYVLTDSIQRAFDGIFTGSYEDTSAVISGKQVVEFSTTGKATVPESLLKTVRGVEGVQQAEGAIFDLQSEGNTVKLYNDKGEAAGNGQAPSFGFGFDGDADRFNPLRLVDGRWAAGSSQVVIDRGTAQDQGWAIGDRIRAAAEGPAKEFTVSGIATLGDVQSLGGATLAVFDLSTAQQLLNKEDQLDTIFLASDEGVTPQQLAADIEPVLPSTAQVRTGDQQASADSSGISEGVDFIRYFLLAFAAIALAVGSFVIYNTITITLAQRVREFATLRTLGASRRQIMRSVLLEGFALGVLASLLGLFGGVALAKGLSAVFDAMDLSMPQAGLVLATRTIIVSLALGVGITMLATIIPARRAMAIPPIAAVREGATLPPGRLTRHGWLRPVTAVAAIVLLVWGGVGGLDTGSSLLVTALGCLFMFVAFWLVSSRLVVPIASAVGRPSERMAGAAGRLALRNSQRNPVRTARTAAALMIGLALVTLVATLGAGMRGTAEESLDNIVDADYVLTSENGYSTYPAAAGKALVAVGEEIGVMGMDRNSDKTFNVFLVKGSDRTPGTLTGDQAIVRESFAEKHGLAIGDEF